MISVGWLINYAHSVMWAVKFWRGLDICLPFTKFSFSIMFKSATKTWRCSGCGSSKVNQSTFEDGKVDHSLIRRKSCRQKLQKRKISWKLEINHRTKKMSKSHCRTPKIFTGPPHKQLIIGLWYKILALNRYMGKNFYRIAPRKEIKLFQISELTW